MAYNNILISLKDKIGENELYLSDLENKVNAGEASAATLKTQKQARGEKNRLLGIIHDLVECIDTGNVMDEDLISRIEYAAKPAGEKQGIVVKAGMSVIEVLAAHPNATMNKIQKACEKAGLSIGPDMIIG